MPIAYHKFIDEKFKLSPELQAKYIDAKEYRNRYILTEGFSEWLESLRGHELDVDLTTSMANAFLVYGKRNRSTLPFVFGGVATSYNIKFPEIEGMTVRSRKPA